jgi:hypothetical protein
MGNPLDFDPDDTANPAPAEEPIPTRDPRWNPRRGDMLNDDPPAGPLEVFFGNWRFVEAGRSPSGHVARWTRRQWRREMKDAEVLWVATRRCADATGREPSGGQ